MRDNTDIGVAIVTESLPPDADGMAHFALQTARHLVARGHEPLVMAPAPAVATTRSRPDGSFDAETPCSTTPGSGSRFRAGD